MLGSINISVSNTTDVVETVNSTKSVIRYQEFEEYWSTSTEHTVYWSLKAFVPPCLVVFGCCGNVIVIVALRQHSIRSSSIGYYLTLLISCYTLLLLSTVGLEWISYISKTTLLVNSSDTMCRICQFVYNVINHSPYWIIVLLLTDRTVYVCFPVYSSTFCTVFMAKLHTVFIFIGLLTINIHNMWTYELEMHGCSIDPRQKDFYTTVWPWISATMNCYLPLLCIHILLLTTTIGLCVVSRQEIAVSPRHVSVAIMTALTFVILTNPSVILNLMQYSKPKWLNSYHRYAVLYLLIEMFQVFVWLNMSVTYIIYLLFVPKLKVKCSPSWNCNFARSTEQQIRDHDGMLMVQHMPLEGRVTQV